MIVKAAQWGNSIGVRILLALAKRKRVSVDSTGEVNETYEGVLTRPAVKKSIP